MTYIYESPDHGETVYRRKLGSSERELHKYNAEKHQQQTQWTLWREILRASQTNPTLKDAVEQAETLYLLSRENI